MGCDLILVSVAFPEKTDLNRSKGDMLKHLKSMRFKKDDVKNYYYDVFGYDDNEEIPDTVKEVKQEFKEAIENFFTSIIEGYRDTSYIYHKKDKIFVSGGLSWGDNPTDSYDYFYKFVSLPVSLLKVGNVVI